MTTIGSWVRQTSRSTGASYYFNAATKESLWHDDTLPAGFAFGREPDGRKFYVDLVSGGRTPARPTAAATTTAPQLSYVAAQTAGDDLTSTAYLPDAASSGANIPAKQRSKRDYLFGVSTGAGVVPESVAWALQCDDVSLYSITEARLAAQMTQLLLQLAGPGSRIVDATACVGGNTLSFAGSGAFAHVTAVELSEQRASMLQHNVSICGLADRVNVIRGDFVELFTTAVLAAASAAATSRGAKYTAPEPHTLLRDAADCVFFDPPWGGPEFNTVPQLDMFLGPTDVADVVSCLTFAPPASTAPAAPFSRLIAIKAPPNYNVAGLRSKLLACRSGAEILRVEHMHKMLLIVVQAQRSAPPLPPSHTLFARMVETPPPPATAPVVTGSTAVSAAGVKRRAAEAIRGADDDTNAASASEMLTAAHQQRRWDSTAHTVQTAFELLLPAAPPFSETRVLTASDSFLHVDADTGIVSIQPRRRQLWSVSAAGPAGISLSAGGVGCLAVSTTSDGASQLCVAASELATAASVFQPRTASYPDCGSQFVALAHGERILAVHWSSENSRAHGPPHLALQLVPLTDFQIKPSLGLLASELLHPWSNAEESAVWLPCLFRPVFAEGSLARDGVFLSSRADLRRDSSPLGLYGRLGIPPGWCPAAAIAQGKRSQVLRFLPLSPPGATDPAPCVLKVQAWDSRVAEEVQAIDAMMSVADRLDEGPAGTVVHSMRHIDPILRPVAHFHDLQQSITVMPNCGLSLEARADKGRVAALARLLAPNRSSDVTHNADTLDRAAHHLLATLLLGLHRIHLRGLLYCDLHPGNVLCDDAGRLTIVDFGSCRRLQGASVNKYEGPTRGG